MSRTPKAELSAAEDVAEAMDDISEMDSDMDDRDKSRGTDHPSSPAGVTRKLDGGGGGLPASLQLFRSESVSKRGDPRAHKTQSLAVVTELISLDTGDTTKVPGFDPARWIVAAGLLEKRRDGRMREGWAKRWFVLGKHTLYYYLLPKTDASGYTPLLGDERGQIKLVDIQEVQAHARDKEYWYLTITVALVRKNTASQIFGSQVSQLVLRTPTETGQLWMDAIITARDAAKSSASPGRGGTALKKSLTEGQQSSVGPSFTSSFQLPIPATPVSTLQNQGSSSDPQQHVSRPRKRRDSTKLRALDLIPLEQSFPFAPKVLVSPFLLLIAALTAIGVFPHLLPASLDMYIPDWVRTIPPHVFLALDMIILLLLVELKRREMRHNSVAREARFRVDFLRKEINELASELPEEVAQAAMLPTTTSEVHRLEEAVKHERHHAGSSMQRRAEMQPGKDLMAWNDSQASTFKLRIGPNYSKNNKKAPSADSLYSLVAMDLLRSDEKICNLAGSKRILLPPHRPGVDPSMEDLRKAGIPRLFIVNAQVPDKGPVMVGKQPDDAGYSLVFYFTAKPELVSQILAGTPSPAAKLLKQYVKEHRTNPDIRRRFKAIGMADNAKELGIPMVGPVIDKFNGKPAIINKVAEIFESGSDMDWFEVDISIFDFPYMAKKTLSALKDRVSEIAVKGGFVFQGEADEELPEILLGGGDICGLDFRLAKVI